MWIPQVTLDHSPLQYLNQIYAAYGNFPTHKTLGLLDFEICLKNPLQLVIQIQFECEIPMKIVLIFPPSKFIKLE